MTSYIYTIPSREDILGLLRRSSPATQHTLKTIAKSLRVKREALDGLNRRLVAMTRDGQIQQDQNDTICLAQTTNFLEGQICAHKEGFGFFISDVGGGDVFLPEREMQKVFHGDQVRVRVVGNDRRGRAEGVIVEVVQRANTHIIGRLLHEDRQWIVIPEDPRMRGRDIAITDPVGHAQAGQIVCIELITQPSRNHRPSGKIIEVLGNIDDPGIEIEIAVRKYGVPHTFSQAAQKAAAKLPDHVRQSDLKERIDLRDIPLITIDGEDARDFDDAVYCEPIKLGTKHAHRLIVAIADVSHYVTTQSGLDQDALARSTSVYFPRRVIPMLPEKLSHGLCSLNPQVDRLVLVCDLIISKQGNIKAYQFYSGVMHSAARLTYTEVAAALFNANGPEAMKMSSHIGLLQHLYEAFQALSKARRARGAIDFETTETAIVCNAAGKIEKILPKVRNDAHCLIEECMLAANVCAANLLEQHQHPGLYRVHAVPTEEKLTTLRVSLKQFGLSLAGGKTPNASDYASLMEKIRLRPDALLLQTMLLRSMQQAVYSPENIGHFGLSYDCYAHFTSPIRRYPDLLTHRAIKAVLQGKQYIPDEIDLNTLNTVNATTKKWIESTTGKKASRGIIVPAVWESLGIHCSSNERRADEASRDVEAWLKCYFMRDRLGEEFTGVISAVTSFGLFVQLDALYIEGLIRISELGADYFHYDEVRRELRGEHTGIRYRLTDPLVVQVSRVDLDGRKIDLRLANTDSTSIKKTRKSKQAKLLQG